MNLFAVDILKALEINPDRVSEIIIHMTHSKTEVKIIQLIFENDKILEVFKDYELKEKPKIEE